MKSKTKNVDILLQPSWLSGLIAVIAGLVITVGAIVAFNYDNSTVQQQLLSWQSTSSPALTVPGEAAPGGSGNSLQNTWPLLGFWMVVGLVVYFIVETAVRGLNEAAEFRRELDYVNADRHLLIRNAIEAGIIRLLAAVLWLVFIEFFFKRIVPYSLLASHAAASDQASAISYLYALLSFVMLTLSIHMHAVFLRLMAGRQRLFSLR